MFFLSCILDKTDTDLKETIKGGDYHSSQEGHANRRLDSVRLRAEEHGLCGEEEGTMEKPSQACGVSASTFRAFLD